MTGSRRIGTSEEENNTLGNMRHQESNEKCSLGHAAFYLLDVLNVPRCSEVGPLLNQSQRSSQHKLCLASKCVMDEIDKLKRYISVKEIKQN